jgi:hypothetical protein
VKGADCRRRKKADRQRGKIDPMPDKKNAIEIQPRDFELLRGLFESRVMTLAHAGALYFPGTTDMAKKRIQKLKAAGFIRERPRRVSDPSVLFLTRKAFELLQKKGKLADYPRIGLTDLERRADVSKLTMDHELQVIDVKAAMVSAIRSMPAYTVAEFSTWPRLYEFPACRPDGQTVTMRPDGYVRIHEKLADGGVSEHAFFLEVDTGTEVLDRVVEKCLNYRDYQRSGGFAVFCGGSRMEAKAYPFQVLIVCQSEKRRNNLAQQLLRTDPPFATMILITTSAGCTNDPCGNIWLTPAAYRSLTPVIADSFDGRRKGTMRQPAGDFASTLHLCPLFQ